MVPEGPQTENQTFWLQFVNKRAIRSTQQNHPTSNPLSCKLLLERPQRKIGRHDEIVYSQYSSDLLISYGSDVKAICISKKILLNTNN